MKKPFALIALAALALLAACSQTPTQSGRSQSPGLLTTSEGVRHYQGQVVVGYEDESGLQEAIRKLGAKEIARIPELKAALLEVPGDAVKASRALKGLPGLRYAEPHLAQVTPPKDDPVELPRSQERGLIPLGNPSDQILDELPQYALDPRHLAAKAAWDRGFEGEGVVVAIIDDPADVTHPDLAANWAGKAYDPVTNTTYTSASDWLNFIQNLGDPADLYHGTFVASTVSAPRDGQGIAGLAPRAKFLPVAIFQPDYVGDFYVARGIVWAVNNGAQVLNNSWGGLGYGNLVKEAFDYALANGVVVVASAGNSYKDEVRTPAGYPGIIASAAADGNRNKTDFSTYGRHISSAAPGLDVLLANPTWLGGGYGLISGTSFSGPYTAAAAALVKAACPGATPYQVRRALETTTWETSFTREKGWGHLNADKLSQLLARGCTSLPGKGSVVRVKVEYINENGSFPGLLADVILRGKGLRPGDPTPVYWARTDQNGEAWFYEIAPGEYDIYVAGADLALTGGLPEERGTFVGTLVATPGSNAFNPDAKLVRLLASEVNLNPTDPYEPNDTQPQATPIAYGQTTQLAYIFGQPQDKDYFKFTGAAGDTIRARVYARSSIGGTLDSYLYLLDANGQVLAENDDLVPGQITDSEITFTLPQNGTYYLVVTSYAIAEGGSDNSPFNKYRLELRKTN
ncbi:MAG: S8 family serine peptidase [Thermus sp.]|uniref:S8 family serine peptidase n=1 Tax=Thermus sp. TaxID=275 RepID=UPI003D0B3809